MDNVSHTLVGAALGEAGLKKYSGLGMATLMIAANLPDLDVIAIPFGANLTFRRGWTHGPLAILILPFVLTACVVGFDRLQSRIGNRPLGREPVRPLPILALSFAGFITHPFLDWLNNYGIRLLMPFSHEWYYGDALFIIDPWLWTMMGAGIFLARRRQRRSAPHPGAPARWALAILTVYIGLMIIGSRSAGHAAETAIYHETGSMPVDVMAGPVPANPLRREVIYDTGTAYGFGSVTWRPRPYVELQSDHVPKNFDHSAANVAAARTDFKDFLYWSRFPYFVVQNDTGGFHVKLGDARFRNEIGAGWATVSAFIPLPEVEH